MSKPTVEPNKLKWQQKLIILANVLSICPLWGVILKLDSIKMSVTVSVFEIKTFVLSRKKWDTRSLYSPVA